MKLLLSRVSSENNKPAKNAYREVIEGNECWVIKVDTVDELIELHEEIGYQLIIDKGIAHDTIPRILIYDSYIE